MGTNQEVYSFNSNPIELTNEKDCSYLKEVKFLKLINDLNNEIQPGDLIKTRSLEDKRKLTRIVKILLFNTPVKVNRYQISFNAETQKIYVHKTTNQFLIKQMFENNYSILLSKFKPKLYSFNRNDNMIAGINFKMLSVSSGSVINSYLFFDLIGCGQEKIFNEKIASQLREMIVKQ